MFKKREPKYPSLRGPDGRTAMPEAYDSAHHLCFLNHDVMLELLRSGEIVGAFDYQMTLTPSEVESFNMASDLFEWMDERGRRADRDAVIRAKVFPALLSDFLQFVFEALQAARKGRLAVAFALIRKPLQENLHLLELMAINLRAFAENLATDPLRMRLKCVGGIDGHKERIATVLAILNEERRFDAGYLAQLRYEKIEDGFDGTSNQAMHLFTSHEAIKTDRLNVNFIFSGRSEKETQWAYWYSRLPYLLFYARRLVEYVFAIICDTTDPEYLEDMERRISAGTVLWWLTVGTDCREPRLRRFAVVTRLDLRRSSHTAGFRGPKTSDLQRMMNQGAFAEERASSVRRRIRRYKRNAPPRTLK
jgi:hypothetical protein